MQNWDTFWKSMIKVGLKTKYDYVIFNWNESSNDKKYTIQMVRSIPFLRTSWFSSSCLSKSCSVNFWTERYPSGLAILFCEFEREYCDSQKLIFLTSMDYLFVQQYFQFILAVFILLIHICLSFVILWWFRSYILPITIL